jgi:SnoaL-like polyketide cyclase
VGNVAGHHKGVFLGIPPSGRAFAVPFVNVARFRAGRMSGESIYFDLARLSNQGGLPTDKLRAAAQTRAQALRVTRTPDTRRRTIGTLRRSWRVVGGRR